MPGADATHQDATGTLFHTLPAHEEPPEPINPSLLAFLADLASREAEPIRDHIIAIIEDYVIDWLESLRPLPYVENLILEVAERRYWLPELVETLGPSTIVEAMRLAYKASHSSPETCAELLPELTSIEGLLIEASGINPGAKIRSVMESSDCKLHALLIAHLIATRPARG